MTPEEILNLAREAGFQTGFIDWQNGEGGMPFIRPLAKENIMGDLLKFAAAMVLIEREECAKIVDEECRTAFAYSFPDALAALEDTAKLIRARKELKL